MKRKSLLFFALSGALFITSCSKEATKNQSESVKNSSVEETTLETTIESTEEPGFIKNPTILPETDLVNDAMYERATSIWPASQNLHRLVSVMEKAKCKEDITIGVIGGSITERFHASNESKSYAQILLRWFEKTFPDTKISYVNAGIGSTDSYLGVHRVTNDLLSKDPDFVVVEFSVNDQAGLFYQTSYESLVTKILSYKTNPAVLLLFMTQENGTSTQESCIEIGKKYALPMISYKQAVLPAIRNGEFTWKDISPDNIHPNDRGHAICGEILWRYLNRIYENLDEYKEKYPAYTPEYKDSYKYENATILDQTTLTPDSYGSFLDGSKDSNRFQKGWHTAGGEDAIEFTISCKNLGILYYKSTKPSYGQYDVYVDGVFVTTIDSYFKNGWGSYDAALELISGTQKQEHKVLIKKSKDSTGDVFSLLGLLAS